VTVVSTEHQFATGVQVHANIGLSTTAIAAIGGQQFFSVERLVHSGSFGHGHILPLIASSAPLLARPIG
jgi:hypothetical protein